MTSVFALGDGDQIRQVIESYLFAGDLEALRDFSAGITSAIAEIKKLAVEDLEADVIVAGGDDVLLVLAVRHVRDGVLDRFIGIFKNSTGSTMSFGYGSTVDAAYVSLRRAKAQGGGVVVGSD